jgi:hypothetical protein
MEYPVNGRAAQLVSGVEPTGGRPLAAFQAVGGSDFFVSVSLLSQKNRTLHSFENREGCATHSVCGPVCEKVGNFSETSGVIIPNPHFP